MNKKVLLLAIATVVLMASCKKDNTQPDLYKNFKADATLRWENGTTVEKSDESKYIFVVDKGGNLFSSANYKIGRVWAGGENYEIIEFAGAPAIGKPTGAAIRKPGGVTNLASLEIVKIDGNKLWVVFKETESSAERRVVQ